LQYRHDALGMAARPHGRYLRRPPYAAGVHRRDHVRLPPGTRSSRTQETAANNHRLHRSSHLPGSPQIRSPRTERPTMFSVTTIDGTTLTGPDNISLATMLADYEHGQDWEADQPPFIDHTIIWDYIEVLDFYDLRPAE